jgi:transposase-like protein
MRIEVRLPKVDPDEYEEPEACPYGCGGRHFKAHGVKGEDKATRDLHHEQVKSYRRECMKCRRTFRVYPQGISRAQQSDRLKAMSVLLYVLGLSYGAVSDFLTALGMPIGKTTVYENVQEAGEASRRRQRRDRVGGGKRAAVGADATYVKVKGEQVGIEVIVDDESGDLLGIAIIVSENAEDVLEVVREVVAQVEAEVLISDDLDTYKNVADELGMDHQVCRSHVKRNVDELADSLREQVKSDQAPPEGVDSSPPQLDEDLETLQLLVGKRPTDGADQLKHFYHRYKAAPRPKRKGERHSVWYRMRMLITRLWEGWHRLTLDQRRDDLDLDGTNNSAERLIGWWIKERYRTMRGYKRTLSILNVVTLTARMGVRSGNYDMTELYV